MEFKEVPPGIAGGGIVCIYNFIAFESASPDTDRYVTDAPITYTASSVTKDASAYVKPKTVAAIPTDAKPTSPDGWGTYIESQFALDYLDDKGLNRNVNVIFTSAFSQHLVSVNLEVGDAGQIIGIADVDDVLGSDASKTAEEQLSKQTFTVNEVSLYKFAGAESTKALLGKDSDNLGKRPFLFISGQQKGSFTVPVGSRGQPVPTRVTIVVLDQGRVSLSANEITLYGWPSKK